MPIAVAIQDLSYAYPSHDDSDEPVWVLRNLDLTVNKGEFLSIMGPSGSGKSTLCLALNGIVPHSTGGTIGGNVTVFGLNTKRQSVARLAQEVGLIFQEPESQLLSTSAEMEVAFGLECMGIPQNELRERVEWGLELMGLKELRRRSPLEMSGGEKQRLAIASILAMTPRILVLDEPTSSLDSQGKRDLFAALRALRETQPLTVVLVEQDSAFMREISDRIAVLNQGKLETVGTPERVLADVEQLQAIGLGVPQISEIAHRLNRKFGTHFRFANLEQAHKALEAELCDR
jgi:energy-coupling factor transporter ATP-binding protein EcfA2